MADTMSDAQAPISDLDLQEAVLGAINAIDFVREADLVLGVNVLDGVATVGGVVLTRIMRRAVLVTAAMVPGVKKVIDNLYTDADLEIAIAQALADDPRTRASQVAMSVMSYQGEVTLAGKVDDPDVVQDASAIAVSVPGVTRVINRLALTASV